MEQKEEKPEVLPWKKELIVTLFKRQKTLRVVLLIMSAVGVVLFLWLFACGFSLYRPYEPRFEWNHYMYHLAWHLMAFAINTFISLVIYIIYCDNKKQLSELITGQKENILKAMDRLAEPIDEETLRYYENLADEHEIRLYPRHRLEGIEKYSFFEAIARWRSNHKKF